MMPKIRHSLYVSLLLLPLQLQAADLFDIWRQAKSESYQAISAHNYNEAVRLFGETLKIDVFSQLRQQWRMLGFDLIRHDQWLVLREIEANGHGMFIFCPACQTDVILQAPHAYSDLKTGELALMLMHQRAFKALALNTLPRNDGVDTAHFIQNYQTAFAEAIAKTMPTTKLVQLHGFSNSKRNSEAGKVAEIIISNGNYMPNRTVARLASCLRSAGFDQTYLFPHQIKELGGTRNAQAKILRQLNSDRFIHFEMNYDLRKRSVSDPETLYGLARCLMEE